MLRITAANTGCSAWIRGDPPISATSVVGSPRASIKHFPISERNNEVVTMDLALSCLSTLCGKRKMIE